MRMHNFANTYTHSRTQSHAHSNAFTLKRIHTFTHLHSHAFTLPHALKLTRQLAYTCTHSHSLTLKCTHIRAHLHSHTRTRSSSYALTLAQTHTRSPSHSHALTIARSSTRTHSHSHALALTRTHSHAHTHPHLHALALALALVWFLWCRSELISWSRWGVSSVAHLLYPQAAASTVSNSTHTCGGEKKYGQYTSRRNLLDYSQQLRWILTEIGAINYILQILIQLSLKGSRTSLTFPQLPGHQVEEPHTMHGQRALQLGLHRTLRLLVNLWQVHHLSYVYDQESPPL